MPEESYLISADEKGERLDVFLQHRLDKKISRSQIRKLALQGCVFVNGRACKPSCRLAENDAVKILYEKENGPILQGEDIPLDIIYSDSDIVVLDKPSGMVVHPGAGNFHGTVVQALLYRFPQIGQVGDKERPGIVHRLDKETSGLLVAALNEEAYLNLKRQFKARAVNKSYLGLISGHTSETKGMIDRPIGRHVKDGKKMSVKTRKPREAQTEYTLIRKYAKYALLDLHPVTGRTHQIRVHLSASGYPLVSDEKYGRKKKPFGCPRLFLHASRLTFKHPASGEPVTFESPLPQDLQEFLDRLSG